MAAIIRGGDDHRNDEIWVTKFDESSAQRFRDKVMAKAKESANDPIIIYIDSYGGYVDSLAKMIETLDEVPNPIITVCMGKAMSCGAILFSHGDVRFCGRHSRIMIHEVSGGTIGDVHDMHADAIETKRLNKHFMGLLARNCKIVGGYDGIRKIIKQRDGREIYLNADESVKFGITDIIGLPKMVDMTILEVVVLPEKKRNNQLKQTKKKQSIRKIPSGKQKRIKRENIECLKKKT